MILNRGSYKLFKRLGLGNMIVHMIRRESYLTKMLMKHIRVMLLLILIPVLILIQLLKEILEFHTGSGEWFLRSETGTRRSLIDIKRSTIHQSSSHTAKAAGDDTKTNQKRKKSPIKIKGSKMTIGSRIRKIQRTGIRLVQRKILNRVGIRSIKKDIMTEIGTQSISNNMLKRIGLTSIHKRHNQEMKKFKYVRKRVFRENVCRKEAILQCVESTLNKARIKVNETHLTSLNRPVLYFDNIKLDTNLPDKLTGKHQYKMSLIANITKFDYSRTLEGEERLGEIIYNTRNFQQEWTVNSNNTPLFVPNLTGEAPPMGEDGPARVDVMTQAQLKAGKLPVWDGTPQTAISYLKTLRKWRSLIPETSNENQFLGINLWLGMSAPVQALMSMSEKAICTPWNGMNNLLGILTERFDRQKSHSTKAYLQGLLQLRRTHGLFRTVVDAFVTTLSKFVDTLAAQQFKLRIPQLTMMARNTCRHTIRSLMVVSNGNRNKAQLAFPKLYFKEADSNIMKEIRTAYVKLDNEANPTDIGIIKCSDARQEAIVGRAELLTGEEGQYVQINARHNATDDEVRCHKCYEGHDALVEGRTIRGLLPASLPPQLVETLLIQAANLNATQSDLYETIKGQFLDANRRQNLATDEVYEIIRRLDANKEQISAMVAESKRELGVVPGTSCINFVGGENSGVVLLANAELQDKLLLPSKPAEAIEVYTAEEWMNWTAEKEEEEVNVVINQKNNKKGKGKKGKGGKRSNNNTGNSGGTLSYTAKTKLMDPTSIKVQKHQCGLCLNVGHLSRDCNCPEADRTSRRENNRKRFGGPPETTYTEKKGGFDIFAAGEVEKEEPNLESIGIEFQGKLYNNFTYDKLIRSMDGHHSFSDQYLNIDIEIHEGIVDTGATVNLISFNKLQSYLRYYKSMIDAKFDPIMMKSSRTFRFGQGSTCKSMGKIFLPVHTQNFQAFIEVEIIKEGNTPLLLSLYSLTTHFDILHLKKKQLISENTKEILQLYGDKSLRFALLEPAATKIADQAIIANILCAEENDDTASGKLPLSDADCQRIHQNFGHNKFKILKLLKERNYDVSNYENLKCAACEKYSPRVASYRRGITHICSRVNELVSGDFLELEGQHYLVMVDSFSGYMLVLPTESTTAEDFVIGIEEWIVRTGEAPMSLLVDGAIKGPTLSDIYRKHCIAKVDHPAETPSMNATAERMVQTAKDMLKRLIHELNRTCDTHDKRMLCIRVCTAINSLPSREGYTPYQLMNGFHKGLKLFKEDNPIALNEQEISAPFFLTEYMTNHNRLNEMIRLKVKDGTIKAALNGALRGQWNSKYSWLPLKGEQVMFWETDTKCWSGQGFITEVSGQSTIHIKSSNSGREISKSIRDVRPLDGRHHESIEEGVAYPDAEEIETNRDALNKQNWATLHATLFRISHLQGDKHFALGQYRDKHNITKTRHFGGQLGAKQEKLLWTLVKEKCEGKYVPTTIELGSNHIPRKAHKTNTNGVIIQLTKEGKITSANLTDKALEKFSAVDNAIYIRLSAFHLGGVKFNTSLNIDINDNVNKLEFINHSLPLKSDIKNSQAPYSDSKDNEEFIALGKDCKNFLVEEKTRRGAGRKGTYIKGLLANLNHIHYDLINDIGSNVQEERFDEIELINWIETVDYHNGGKTDGKDPEYYKECSIQSATLQRPEVYQETVEENPLSEFILAAELTSSEVQQDKIDPYFRKSKQKEWNSFLENKCLEVVKRSSVPATANLLGGRFVCTYKYENPNKPEECTRRKSRFCIQGYQDDRIWGSCGLQSDAPTALPFAKNLVCSVAATNGYTLKTVDIPTAFLRGDNLPAGDDVYLRIGKWFSDIEDIGFKEAKDREFFRKEYLFKLVKPIYGLNDAPFRWYKRLETELAKLGFVKSAIDPATFILYEGTQQCSNKTLGDSVEDYKTRIANNSDRYIADYLPKEQRQVAGVCCVHVDDIMYAGNKYFENKMQGIHDLFKIKEIHEGTFLYLGGLYHQSVDKKKITLSYDAYISKIKAIEIPKNVEDTQVLPNEKQKNFGSLLGSLLWVSVTQNAMVAYRVSSLASYKGIATIGACKEANSILRYLQTHPLTLTFTALDLEKLTITCMTDASFNTQAGGKSQAGLLIMLSNGLSNDTLGNCVFWKSSRIKRVAHSTYAAELLACLEGTDYAQLIRFMASEFFGKPIPITTISDCMSLCKSTTTTVVPREKSLVLVLTELRQFWDSEKKIFPTGEPLLHIDTDSMLADILTKRSKGPNHEAPLRLALERNRFIKRENTYRIRWGSLKNCANGGEKEENATIEGK